MSAATFIDSFSWTLRYSVRGLQRRPAFTIAAVITLALGIGATTAIFSVVYSVLIKPLPYPNADELISINPAAPGENIDDLTSDDTFYLAVSDENRTFASVGLWDERTATLTDGGTTTRVPTIRVTDGTLQALGVQPMLGRWFTEEETIGPPTAGLQSVILSYEFWQRRFGGDEAVLGREFTMEVPSNSSSFPWAGQWRVVGVMPRGFRFLDVEPLPAMITPLRVDPATAVLNNFSFNMLARLNPGMTQADAQADVERMIPIWLDAWPTPPGSSLTRDVLDQDWQITARVRPLKDDLVGSVASTLWVLMAAISAVLLIACGNIANLMLVRAEAQRQDFVIRAALGATPGLIAKESLTQSLVLGICGGFLGLTFAYMGVAALVENGPSNLPRLQEIAVDMPVFFFTVAISLASTVAFGSIMALKHAMNINAPMGGSARGLTANRQRNATRSSLVVVQVALVVVLVVSGTLMMRTFQALRDIDPGFRDPGTIQTARTWIPFSLFPDNEQVTQLQHEILDRIAALPGVTSVGFTDQVPMSVRGGSGPVLVEGDTVPDGEMAPGRRWNYVSPGYFQAMGTKIIAGRDITWSDIESGGRVAFVSQDFARDIAGEPSAAVGQRIRIGTEGTGWHEVIGVVQSVYQDGLYENPPSTVYWPVLVANMFGQPNVTFAIRSDRAGSASFIEEVRQAIWSVNANIAVAQERTVREFYSASFARTSFTLVLLGIASAMALASSIVLASGASQ